MSYYDTNGTDPPPASNPTPVRERAASLPDGELMDALNGLDGFMEAARLSLRVTAAAGLAGTDPERRDRA